VGLSRRELFALQLAAALAVTVPLAHDPFAAAAGRREVIETALLYADELLAALAPPVPLAPGEPDARD
jgi:hypothetical protein